MDKFVSKYLKAKSDLMKNFNCMDEYLVKPLVNCVWGIRQDDDLYFLSYKGRNEKVSECVVAKKNSEPLIFKSDSHTLVVGIECIKIAMIFKNENMADL